MAKTLASLIDGRVVPWYSEDPIPSGFVEIPGELHAKFAAGEITDGVALAKAALAVDVGEAPKAATRRPKASKEKASETAAAPAAGESPSGGGNTFL